MIVPTSKTQAVSETDPSPAEEIPTRASILEELERICVNQQFRGSARGKQFLTYVVQNALDGRNEMLKERVIGSELFGKPVDYATGEEPVVRVQAGEVRRRLHENYLSQPAHARVLIELPTGSYTPTFQWLVKSLPIAPSPPPDSTPNAPELTHNAKELPRSETHPRRHNLLPWSVAIIAFGVAIVCALFAFSPRLFRTRTELDRFWAPGLHSSSPVLICVGQPVVYLPRLEFFERYSATHGGEFRNPVQRLTEALPLNPSEDLKWKDLYAVDDLGVAVGDVYAAMQLSKFLDSQSKPSQLRIGQNYTFEDLRSSPSILIGAFNNKWSMQLTSNLRYRFDDGSPGLGQILDSASPGRSWRVTTNEKGQTVRDFGLVARLVNSKTGQFTVTIAGVGAAGTEAASEVVSNADYSHDFLREAPADWEKKNVEIVVETTVTGIIASPPHVVATYFW